MSSVGRLEISVRRRRSTAVEDVEESGAELSATETVDDEVDGGTESQQRVAELPRSLRYLVALGHVPHAEADRHDGVGEDTDDEDDDNDDQHDGDAAVLGGPSPPSPIVSAAAVRLTGDFCRAAQRVDNAGVEGDEENERNDRSEKTERPRVDSGDGLRSTELGELDVEDGLVGGDVEAGRAAVTQG